MIRSGCRQVLGLLTAALPDGLSPLWCSREQTTLCHTSALVGAEVAPLRCSRHAWLPALAVAPAAKGARNSHSR